MISKISSWLDSNGTLTRDFFFPLTWKTILTIFSSKPELSKSGHFKFIKTSLKPDYAANSSEKWGVIMEISLKNIDQQ